MSLFIFCLLTSLKILAIHVICRKGHIFFGLRNQVARFIYKTKLTVLEKPLYDCMTCMASIWGLLFWAIGGREFHPVSVIFIVCGINIILARTAPEMPETE